MTDFAFSETDDALYFLPLGGAGEFGVNLNLYGYRGKWLMVDLGMGFGDETMPGIELLVPNPTFIEERREDLVGLVLTHAHEDHIGAIPHLWPRLRCPIYATPFTAAMVRTKLAENELLGRAKITEIALNGVIELDPFRVEYVTMAHSIPEPNALIIRTPAGVVIHSGDWKLDPDPIVGPPTDEETLRRTGEDGVLALICDSTNALTPGHSGSEADLLPSLTALFGRYKNRIAIASFASNVARLETIAKAAQANDRHVALVGRSLWRIESAARQTGYLKDLPPFLTEHDLGYLPRDKLVMICTGSQGEPRSALSRISSDDHPQARLEAGDVAIFSARGIPGNERAIIRVQNQLVQLGVEIVTSHDAFVHVSGHPAQDELTTMYEWVRPQVAVPVHGEAQHLAEHSRLARAAGVEQTVIPENGALIRLHPSPAEIVDHVESGLWALDGKSIVPLENGAFRDRNRMINNGAAVATVVLDRKGRLIADPKISLLGLPTGLNGSDLIGDVVAAVRDTIGAMPLQALRNDEEVRQAVRIAVRRQVNATHGKKPLTDVQLVRV